MEAICLGILSLCTDKCCPLSLFPPLLRVRRLRGVGTTYRDRRSMLHTLIYNRNNKGQCQPAIVLHIAFAKALRCGRVRVFLLRVVCGSPTVSGHFESFKTQIASVAVRLRTGPASIAAAEPAHPPPRRTVSQSSGEPSKTSIYNTTRYNTI